MSLVPTILLYLSLGAATAQEGTPTHHAPPPELADEPALVPAAPLHAPPPSSEPQPPSAPDPGHLEALMAFRRDHLDLRVSPGWRSTTVVSTGISWGWWPYHGWGFWPSFGVSVPVHGYADWAVFQGPAPLSVPAYLETVGDELRLAALETELRRTGIRSKVGVGTGALGVAALVASVVGMREARSPETFQAWSALGTGGILTAVTGAMVYSSASNRAGRLERDFSATVEHDDAQAQVQAYNEQLRLALGLTPAEARRVLSEPGPARAR